MDRPYSGYRWSLDKEQKLAYWTSSSENKTAIHIRLYTNYSKFMTMNVLLIRDNNAEM